MLRGYALIGATESRAVVNARRYGEATTWLWVYQGQPLHWETGKIVNPYLEAPPQEYSLPELLRRWEAGVDNT